MGGKLLTEANQASEVALAYTKVEFFMVTGVDETV